MSDQINILKYSHEIDRYSQTVPSCLFARKPEPEVCNLSCPPLGCPLGPCPGMCCSKGICDPCCVSKMPRDPPPRCYVPCCLKNYARNVNRLAYPCGSSPIDINRETQTVRSGTYSNLVRYCQPGFQQNPCPPPYNFTSIVSPCTMESIIWNA